MDKKPTSIPCNECDGKGAETNTIMIPERVFSERMIPATEVMPCIRCEGSGKLFLCPECGTEMDVDPGYPDTREEPGQPPALICKACYLEFDEAE